MKDARTRQESGLVSLPLSYELSLWDSHIQYSIEIEKHDTLKSITQERDLDEFLNTAQLAGTEFTAGMGDLNSKEMLIFIPASERRNVKIVQAPAASSGNPYLLSETEEKSTLQKHQLNKERLGVPRKPPWTKAMTATQLDRQEKDAFLDWRRGLAQYAIRLFFL